MNEFVTVKICLDFIFFFKQVLIIKAIYIFFNSGMDRNYEILFPEYEINIILCTIISYKKLGLVSPLFL